MHLYEIPVVQPELRHEESIIQALNALEHLNNVIQDAFDKVDKRIAQNLQNVESIQKRIEVADEKTKTLMKINNKSIKILSPAKYPPADIEKFIPMTFLANLKANVKLDQDYEVRSAMNPTSHRNIQEKLQFYHVKTSKKFIVDPVKQIPDSGLGKYPPAHVDSVNALLLYNSKENPYENYKTVDNLNLQRVPQQNEETEEMPIPMDAAPESIHNKLAKNKNFLDQIVYSPEMRGAPELDLPGSLADLPGIANDISFFDQETENQVLSPSAFNIKQLLGGSSPLKPVEKVMPIVAAMTPEQKVPVVVVKETKDNDTPDFKAVVSAPPPPPPPMSQPEVKRAELPPVVASDARSSLMDAIRKAGGTKKLRASDERAEPKPAEQKEKKAAAPAMDLMSDLHNKLMMRRKGISGAKDQGANVMDKISSMIPPPPPKQQHSSNSEESEETENDWE